MRIGRPLAYLKTAFSRRNFFSNRSLLPDSFLYEQPPRNSLLVAQSKGILFIPSLRLPPSELDECLAKVIERMNEIQAICLPSENLQERASFIHTLLHTIQNRGKQIQRVNATWEKTGASQGWRFQKKTLTPEEIEDLTSFITTCKDHLYEIHLGSSS